MMLMSPYTHRGYRVIVEGVCAKRLLRTDAVCALLPDESVSRVRTWLNHLVARGHLRVAADTTYRGDGGRLYAPGDVPLPPFDDAEQRVVYERAARCYAMLHAAGDAGSTSPVLHAAINPAFPLSVTASRLAAWERRGKVRCDRSVRPARWFAIDPPMPPYDEMLRIEHDRRHSTAMPTALRVARVRQMAEARSRREAIKAKEREDRALQRVIDRMPVAPWIAPLAPKRVPPTSVRVAR